MKIEDKFIGILLADIAAGKLVLPTLPELALKIRRMVEDPYLSAEKLSTIIGTDAALSARLLQVANSVFFRGLKTVENVQTAVVRLGSVCVRNVVTSLVMDQLYHAKTTSTVKADLHRLWVHGTRVAALAHVIAKRYTKLNPEEAMLAGLIHDIGILPILSRAVDFPDLVSDKAALQRVIDSIHPEIGKLVLEEWHFPAELVLVAAEHENLARPADALDYVDVVTVANLHSHLSERRGKPELDWNTIPAFKRLGLTPDQSIRAMAEAQAEIAGIQKLLMS